jgi:hypothetical protein
MKAIKDLSKLVDYACSGKMAVDDVTSTVVKLKAAKAAVVEAIAELESADERRKAYRQLNDLSYRLYHAVAVIRVKDEGGKQASLVNKEIPFDTMANMILCYQCH